MLCVYGGPLWRRVWCRWLVGLVSDISTCIGGQAVWFGEESLCSSRLGVIVFGVLWMGAYAFGGAMVGGVWCDCLGLLAVGRSVGWTVGFLFPWGLLSRFDHFSVAVIWGVLERCRFWLRVFCD